jgi:hypothetical protein
MKTLLKNKNIIPSYPRFSLYRLYYSFLSLLWSLKELLGERKRERRHSKEGQRLGRVHVQRTVVEVARGRGALSPVKIAFSRRRRICLPPLSGKRAIITCRSKESLDRRLRESLSESLGESHREMVNLDLSDNLRWSLRGNLKEHSGRSAEHFLLITSDLSIEKKVY